MDSFYELPRRAPKMTTSDKIFPAPVVPEVSLIFQNENQPVRPQISSNNNLGMSYNAWKSKNPVPIANNKENFRHEYGANMSPQGFNRKQVRFENPAGNSYMHRAVETNQYKQQMIRSEPQKLLPSSTLISKPFEQIYIENIPNRHLDLSIIDVPNTNKPVRIERCFYGDNTMHPRVQNDLQMSASNSHQIKSANLGRTTKEHENFDFCDDSFYELPKNKIKHSGLVDLYNYNVQLPPRKQFRSDNAENGSNNDLEESSDEPTMKDLLKIIQHQSEQLLLLQKQVANLLTVQDNLKQIEPPPPPPPPYDMKHVYGTKNRPHETMALFAQKHHDHDQAKSSKFAIDVMTSFEVSIRPPQHFNRNKLVKDYLQSEAKIQEIYENDKQNNSGDDSKLSICEPVVVSSEPPPSPDNSIHVDMQDYSSDSSNEEDNASSNLGWTIYNNVMGQVNNILRKTPTNPDTENAVFTQSMTKLKDKTMKKVREATLKHLRSVGVNVDNIPVSDTLSDSSVQSNDNSNGQEYSPTEISFAVKQLLMKYLPNEELAKVTSKQNKLEEYSKDPPLNLIKGRPEFSFATVQYMKKYNLMGSNSDKIVKNTCPKKQSQPNDPTKFLDITALKQQPKLL